MIHFLDLNVWITLADGRSDQADRIRGILQDLVAKGKVFCPLSWSLFSELLKQEPGSALRVGQLMEELSLNISFAADNEIYDSEAKAWMRQILDPGSGSICLERSALYVPIAGLYASEGSLSFPAGWSTETASELTDQLASILPSVSLTTMLNWFKPQLPRPGLRLSGPLPFTEVWQERWQETKGDHQKMREAEEDYIIKAKLIPRLNTEIDKLSPEAIQRLVAYLQTLGTNPHQAAHRVLVALPAFGTYVDIM